MGPRAEKSSSSKGMELCQGCFNTLGSFNRIVKNSHFSAALCPHPLSWPCHFPRAESRWLVPFLMDGVHQAALEDKKHTWGHGQGGAPTPKRDVSQGSSQEEVLPACSLRLTPALCKDLKRKHFPKGSMHTLSYAGQIGKKKVSE